MTWLAGIIVVATGLWLVAQAISIVAAPRFAQRFLTGFASSARAHYMEQVVRLLAGSALVTFAAEMRFPDIFRVFGWIILATSAGLLLIPWRWHHRFGKWAIPLAIRHLKLYALGSLLLGTFMLYAAWPR